MFLTVSFEQNKHSINHTRLEFSRHRTQGKFFMDIWRVLQLLKTINFFIQVLFLILLLQQHQKNKFTSANNTNNFPPPDTDSIIYMAPKNAKPPFEVGSYLGQMKDEYPHHNILSFYRFIFVCLLLKKLIATNSSGGAKQYGLELQHRTTREISHVLKCRGVTLDSCNEDQFNFERFKVIHFTLPTNEIHKQTNNNLLGYDKQIWHTGTVSSNHT